MKFLIIGLGNIGEEYHNTRHNIGFMLLDALAKASNIFFSPDKTASVAEYKFKGRKFILIKPSTYMNLSGKAVNYWMQKENITIENILVLTDDLALPFGTLRMRGNGSDGGHNGLKSINEILNSQNYARLRFGIGNNYPKGKQVDFVLSQWTKEEEEILNLKMEQSIEIIKSFGTLGLQRTMSEFNNK